MNWKEFLKPDWKKIIVAIIIFPFVLNYTLGFIINLIYTIQPLLYGNFAVFIIPVIFAIILSYFLSCSFLKYYIFKHPFTLKEKTPTKEGELKGWRGFLQFTRRKFRVMFIIGFIFASITIIWFLAMASGQIPPSEFEIINTIWMLTILLLLSPVILLFMLPDFLHLLCIVISPFVVIFYWFVISSLIVWIYDKRKKK